MDENVSSPGSGLRRLLACPDCRLQYDVSDVEVGSRFHCSCGYLLIVPRFEPRGARVVRCSSCGGPRQRGSGSCRFCGADFTLHERDLHTICPGCLTRISDSARFCHSCGLAIAPQARVGRETEYHCPACRSRHHLVSRKWGDSEPSLLECPCCGGTWLGHELFDHLQTTALKREVAVLKPVRPTSTTGGPLTYRRCPQCGRHMSRRNFERRSGVIVDICPQDGVWLDQGELESILQWIRNGGLTRTRQAEARGRRDRSNPFRRRHDPLERAIALPDDEDGKGGDFLRGVVEFFS